MSKKPGVHIYTLSRLVNAPAGAWERKIREIEEGRDRAFAYYQPMREAVLAYLSSDGKGRDGIVAKMLAAARHQPRSRGQDPEADNLKAFGVFEDICYPRIARFTRGLLRKPQGVGVPFEAVLLLGAPHFEVVDEYGCIRYVFLQASDWKDDQVKAYLELLAIIVEGAFAGGPDSILHMNLRTGHIAGYRSSKRMRSRCADAARHYARVFQSAAA